MKHSISPHASWIVFYAPGILLILAALAALVAPRLVLSAVAGFFLFFGFLLCLGAYKLLSFKRRFEAMAQELRKGAASGIVHSRSIPSGVVDGRVVGGVEGNVVGGRVVGGTVILQRFHVGQAGAEQAFSDKLYTETEILEAEELGADETGSDTQRAGRKIILH